MGYHLQPTYCVYLWTSGAAKTVSTWWCNTGFAGFHFACTKWYITAQLLCAKHVDCTTADSLARQRLQHARSLPRSINDLILYASLESRLFSFTGEMGLRALKHP